MIGPAVGCVVVPFGVPAEGMGLGLGLAAAVQASARMAGAGIAIARLQAQSKGAAPARDAPLEVFMTPDAWCEMARRGDGPAAVGVVLTGAFEPPVDGDGSIRLVAFDSGDGRPRASTDARVDGDTAGAGIVGAIEQLWSPLGGDIGALAGLRELGWEALESVLRGERCALHDPARGGPHDGLAAMLHFGRAIGEAPAARYPVERLATLALEAVLGASCPPNVAAAALRALETATSEAVDPGALEETLCTLLIRLGKAHDAERRVNAALVRTPQRPRLYATLSQALRAQDNLEAALVAADAGLADAPDDAGLHVERGSVLAARGQIDAAFSAWRRALELEPLNPAAFVPAAAHAIRAREAALAQSLADRALGAADAHPDVFRAAVQLVLNSEADGIARSARLAPLCERVLERCPKDAAIALVLARAELSLGRRAEGRARLERVERTAPSSAAAAEAQTLRLYLDNPAVELELESLVRAVATASEGSLGDVVGRARRLATEQGSWRGWMVVAIAEARRRRWNESRASLRIALEIAPGAAPAHLEMARVLLAMGRVDEARVHVQTAIACDGPSPRALELFSLAAAPASQRRGSAWLEPLRRIWKSCSTVARQRYVNRSS